MPKLLLSLFAAVAIGGSVAGGGVYLATRGGEVEAPPEQAVQPSATATPSPAASPAGSAAAGQLVRWGNVTVTIPADSSVHFVQDMNYTGIVLELRPDAQHPEWEVVIDANSGSVLSDSAPSRYRPALDAILSTLTVSPLDAASAPWPYSANPPDVPRETWGNISWIPVVPSSGIKVVPGLGDPKGPFIEVTNGYSTLMIDALTRAAYPDAKVRPEDQDAFNCFVSAITLIGSQ